MLYVDRMDVLRRAGSDLPVLRQISAVLGATTWFNTVRLRRIQVLEYESDVGVRTAMVCWCSGQALLLHIA